MNAHILTTSPRGERELKTAQAFKLPKASSSENSRESPQVMPPNGNQVQISEPVGDILMECPHIIITTGLFCKLFCILTFSSNISSSFIVQSFLPWY